MDNQFTYFNNAIDKLITADIIETIHPEDVKCCSPITLAQKAHERPGLSLNEIQQRVNEECIAHGMAPAHNMDAKVPTPQPRNTIQLNHRHGTICQNYSALNKVTQVFPTPVGGHLHQTAQTEWTPLSPQIQLCLRILCSPHPNTHVTIPHILYQRQGIPHPKTNASLGHYQPSIMLQQRTWGTYSPESEWNSLLMTLGWQEMSSET